MGGRSPARGSVKMTLKKRKKKKPKERNFLVPMMRAHCKPGPHTDKKKEAARKACRDEPELEDDQGFTSDL
jgi:hypothetical protein